MNVIQASETLYEKRQKIYPREVHGVFAFLRSSSSIVILSVFFFLPWLSWDGHQSILFDLPARKFHIFAWTFWPQDFIYLALLLILAAFSLFFFTAIAGRLWCGYACPQTVWTELFLLIERKVEGNRMRQIKLDRQPMNLRKFSLKALKHGLWLAIAALTGFTFVAYFSPAAALGHDMLAFTAGPWETFWVAFYGFATYGNAGWMREQVCKYMCPYARFQSAMFDNDTLTVTYDEKRGEPRGSRAGGSEYREAGLGDCINCTMCVQVCPTGIDIRDGLQYECIGCSACIDVCNDVMAKMNYPKGLIRYTTHNAVEGKPSRLIRPRILVYGAILVGLIAVFIFLLLQRSTLQLDVIRDRNQLYREVHGTIENVYTLKVINMDDESHRYSLAIDELPSAELIIETPRIDVNAGAVLDVPVRVRVNEDDLKNRSTKIAFVMVAVDDETIRISESARFLGPIP